MVAEPLERREQLILGAARDPGSFVDDVDQHPVADLAGVDPDRAVAARTAGRCRSGWPAPVPAVRCRPARPRRRPPPSPGPARAGRKPVAPLLMPTRARCTTSSRYTRRSSGRTTPAASRDESSRLPTSAVSWSTDSSTVASSSAVSSAENPTSSLRRLDTAALAAASGVRRSWLTADSSDRRSSSACAMASALLASSASSRCLTRPAACVGDRVEHPAVAGGELAARHQHPELVVADLDRGVGCLDVEARVVADAGDELGLPSRSRSRLTARCEYVSRTRSSSVSRSAPRSTEPANSASSSASCEARRASRARLAAPSTSAATATATTSSTTIGDGAVGFGDREACIAAQTRK